MPRGDGTGPMGMGPRTGRGVGFCADFRGPGNFRNFPGGGLGFARGRERRYRRMFCFGGLLPGCAYLAYRWKKRNKNQE